MAPAPDRQLETTRAAEEAVPERPIRGVVREPEPMPAPEPDESSAEAQRQRFERPPQNGAYEGPLAVRTLERGESGEELSAKLSQIAPGQVWSRGKARVRVLEVRMGMVKFQELDMKTDPRSLPGWKFLRSSRPPVAPAPAPDVEIEP